MSQTCGEAIEQAVERRRQLRQLVVRWAEREAVVEMVLAPLCRLSRHSHHRSKRRAKEPARSDHHEQQNEPAQDERGEQSQFPRLLVRGERNPGDDGAEPLTAHEDRHAVQTRVVTRHVEEPGAARRECVCCTPEGRRRARLLERPAAGEDPEVGAGRTVVRAVADAQPAAGGSE